MPPISPKSWDLPFESKQFTWATFEDFFCAFLASQPKLLGPDDQEIRVKKTRLYGRKGDKQNGIDIKAEMANGETWVFQCKHYPKTKWTPGKTREAVEACNFEADRKFLLVTRTFSEECNEIIDGLPDWEIWDSRKISNEFLNRVDPIKGAGILYRHFGPGWPEQFFDLSGHGPLIGGEARYFKLLKKARTFHHRTNLVGRAEDLKRLNAFVKSKQKEALLLVGRAGIGKSRLLLEFSRKFNRKQRNATLWFISDDATIASDYAKAIDASPKPLILVFDDAHRLGEIRRALFPVIAKQDDIKIVLSLRPGPTNQIRAELIEAGYESGEIEEWPPLKELKVEGAMDLAKAVLGKDLTPKTRQLFAQIARESPLLAVMGAELWLSGMLQDRDLRDTDEFRDKILLTGFETDIKAIEKRFGPEPTRTFAKLLALLSPVKFDSDFFEPVANFVGHEIRQDQVSELAEAFDDAGLLYETEAGFRIVPDLLSDQLAFEACYDSRGGDRNFAVEVIRHFDPVKFPRIIQHVAEAEWQAASRLGSDVSIMTPIWNWFRDRFKDSPFFNRKEQLGQWADIAHLQPERTIHLAEDALRLTEAPGAPNIDLFWTREFENHGYVLEGLPALLKPLANADPNYTARCFDILWELGKNLAPPVMTSRENDHPILVMGEIAKFEYWKSFNVSDAALEWVKQRALDGSMLGNENGPAFLLSELLKPFFSVVSDETWATSDGLLLGCCLISISETARFREEVLSICRQVSEMNELSLALGVINVIEEAIQPLWIPYGGDATPKQHEEWSGERRKALDLAQELVQIWKDPLFQFRIRKRLEQELAFSKSSDFKEAVQKVFDVIPDSLELRMARVTLSYAHDEFHEDTDQEDWQEKIEQQWKVLLSSVVDELVEAHPDPSDLMGVMRTFDSHAVDHGFSPNLGPLLSTMSETYPSVALEMAGMLIHESRETSDHWFSNLIGNATNDDCSTRIEFCRNAIKTGKQKLVASAIESLGWLRRFDGDGDLETDGWDLIFSVIPEADSEVTRALLHFVWTNAMNPSERDWEILAQLPKPEHDDLKQMIVRRAVDLLRHGAPRPGPGTIRRILELGIDSKPTQQDQFEYALQNLAKQFPVEVFLFLWQRIQYGKNLVDQRFDPLPLRVEALSLTGITNDPQIGEIVKSLEDRVLTGPPLDHNEKRMFQIALFQEGTNLGSSLKKLLDRISTEEQLQEVVGLVTHTFSRPIILVQPAFTKSLLVKARSFGKREVYNDTFDRLKHLPGIRSSRNGNLTPEWKGLVEATERVAHEFADDAELGPLYKTAVEIERDRIEADQRDFAARKASL